MANLTMKSALSVKGIMDIHDDGSIWLEVEDINDPINLAELADNFNGKPIKLSITYDEELGAPSNKDDE